MAFGVNVRAEAAKLAVKMRAVDFEWCEGPRLFCYMEEPETRDSFHMVGTPEEVKSTIEAMDAAYRAWEEAGRPAERYEP
jgi:hypothetical protein